MTRAALIGLTVAISTPPLLFLGAVLGWLSRDREDNEELARMRKVAEECDAVLAAIQATPKTVPQQRRVRVTCGVCGVVEVQSDLVAQPVTDAEYSEALSVILTQHSIESHLTEWGAA